MKYKKFIVYETTNLINGRYYVGVHKQTKKEFDGYLGSGKILGEAVKKYGAENFERVTLFEYDNQNDAFEKEAEIVNNNFLIKFRSYNIHLGGHGGSHPHSEETKLKMSISRKGKRLSQEHKNKIGKSNTGNVSWIEGKSHSVETKNKMSLAHTGKFFSDESRKKMSVAKSSSIRKPHSEASKKKMAESKLGYTHKILICPFCSKEGGSSGMKSWHFEYCKENPNRINRK